VSGKKWWLCLSLILFWDCAFFSNVLAQSQPQTLPASFFSKNRQLLLNRLPSATLAIFFAGDVRHKHVDLNYPYRQERSFYYLTGINEPKAILVLAKPALKIQGKLCSEVLFLLPPDSLKARWSGTGLTPKTAKEILGFQESLHDSLFGSTVLNALEIPETNYNKVALYQPKLAFKYPNMISQVQKEFEHYCFKENHKVISSAEWVSELRAIKRPAELQSIRIAVERSIQGMIAAIKTCVPGVYEYDLAHEALYTFTKKYGLKPAYPPMAGSGPNALILHYWQLNRIIHPNELVLLDLGAECNGYAADLSRTLPSSGSFTPAQKLIYNMVLKAQNKAIAGCKVGAKLTDVHQAAQKSLSKSLLKAGIISNKNEVSRYMWHYSCHHIGLDVHDPYINTLSENMVLAIEPGLYIPKNSPCSPEFWEIGVRIEDMVRITKEEPEVLSKGPPKTIHELEKFMLLNEKPAIY